MPSDSDPLTLVDWVEIHQALTWRDRLLNLDSSTLTVRVAYRIETLLEQEITA